MLQRLKNLRSHLIQNWDVSLQWIMSGRATNGAPCLLLHKSNPDGMSIYTVGRITCPNEVTADEIAVAQAVQRALGGSALSILTLHGRDGILQALDRAIARLEEHQVVGPAPTPAPAEIVSQEAPEEALVPA